LKSRIFAFAAVAALAVVPAAAPGAQPSTTEPTMEIPVQVTIRDTGITMTPKMGERGAVALFIVRNLGKKTHSFAVGEGAGGVAMQANIEYKKGLATRPMKPGSKPQVLLIFLDYRGRLPYHSTVAADAKNPRMKGFFTIF
jgi:hypothetical protein